MPTFGLWFIHYPLVINLDYSLRNFEEEKSVEKNFRICYKMIQSNNDVYVLFTTKDNQEDEPKNGKKLTV